MSAKFLLTPKAQADLRDIVDFGLRNWSAQRVDAYLADIQSSVNRIADFPSMGRPQLALRAKVRTFATGSHVIVYVGEDPIEVVRIVHQSSDWTTLLTNI